MPFLTQRYALPIHHAARRDEDHHLPFERAEHVSRAESTLRRKTPNGTLNAGYDASIEDANPPLKHQLLPLNESHGILDFLVSWSQWADSENDPQTDK